MLSLEYLNKKLTELKDKITNYPDDYPYSQEYKDHLRRLYEAYAGEYADAYMRELNRKEVVHPPEEPIFKEKLPGIDTRVKVKQFTLSGEFVAEYDSLKQAARKTGIMYQGIGRCVNGYNHTAGGYKWEKA